MKAGSPGNHRDADPGRLQAAMPADAQGKATGMAIAQNRPGTMQASVGLVETLAPFAFGLPRSNLPSMANRLIRYLAYIIYLLLAAATWLAIVVFGFGFVPFAERACDLAPNGCPPPNPFVWGLSVLTILLSVPLTVFGFVLIRNLLHREQTPTE